MKKYFLTGLFALILLSSAAGAAAQTTQTGLGYTPLEPINGVSFAGVIGEASLQELLSQLFKILFAIGGLLSVVMLTIGGIQYMMSSIPGVKKDGLERAKAAFYGMLILAASYLILFTINPDLLSLRLSLPSVSAPRTAATPGSGTMSTGVSADVCAPGSLSAQPEPVGGDADFTEVTLGSGVQSYPATSPCGRQVSSYLPEGDQLRNTARGRAVVVINSGRSVSTYLNVINDFNTRCESAGGRASLAGTNTNRDYVYVCLQR